MLVAKIHIGRKILLACSLLLVVAGCVSQRELSQEDQYFNKNFSTGDIKMDCGSLICIGKWGLTYRKLVV